MEWPHKIILWRPRQTKRGTSRFWKKPIYSGRRRMRRRRRRLSCFQNLIIMPPDVKDKYGRINRVILHNRAN